MILKVIEFKKPANGKGVLNGYLIYSREYADNGITEDIFDTQLLAECNTPNMLGEAKVVLNKEMTAALQKESLNNYPPVTRAVEVQMLPSAKDMGKSGDILPPHGFYEFNFRCKQSDDKLMYLPMMISCRINSQLIGDLIPTIAAA